MEGNRRGENVLESVRKRTETNRGTEREGQGMTPSYLWGDCLPLPPMGPIRKSEGRDPGRS